MIGLFSKTTDSSFVEASGLAGFDFIIIDQEVLFFNIRLLIQIVYQEQ